MGKAHNPISFRGYVRQIKPELIKTKHLKVVVVVVTLMGVLTNLFLQDTNVVYAKNERVEPEPVEVIIEWTKERIEQEIRDTFPEEPDLAVAIAKAESGLNPDAVNPEAHRGCTSSRGIFQIACVHHTANPKELNDVKLNIEKARSIYLKQGFRPWGVCHDGKVDCGF